ncbi:MAG: hypothetical protein RLY14_1126 [Planctomycetota bacterium]|jgi:hypothetical protein
MSRRGKHVSSISLFAFQDIITSVVGIFILIIICMILQLRETRNGSGASAQSYQELLAIQQSISRESSLLSKSLSDLTASLLQAKGGNRFSEQLVAEELESMDRMLQERLVRAEEQLEKVAKRRAEAEKDKERLKIAQAANGPELEELQAIQGQLSRVEREMKEIDTENPMVFSKTNLNGRPLCILEVKKGGVEWVATTTGEKRSWSIPRERATMLEWFKTAEASQWHFLVLIKPSGAMEFEGIRKSLTDSGVKLGFDVVAEDQAIRIVAEGGVSDGKTP